MQLFEGITASLYHSEKITFTHITLGKDADLPEHKHIHEQWTHVIAGELQFKFNIKGEKALLTTGMSTFIPADSLHSGKAMTECNVIDCFLPVREDFVAPEKQML